MKWKGFASAVITLLSLVLLTNANDAQINQQVHPPCRGPDTKPGSCMELQECAPLLTKQQDESFVPFLRVSRMVCGNKGNQVCCPNGQKIPASNPNIIPTSASNIPKKTDKVPSRLPSMKDGCGYANVVKNKIVGGKVSKIGAWPWIALLGYNDPKEKFKCGGTLITARHVITAAHCIVPILTFVRLGEHDLSTDMETPHEDIQIAKKVTHPEYKPRIGRSDLAILYLERNVEFTTKITPICLPYTPNLRQKSYLGLYPFVAGWGKTMERGKAATVLNELQIDILENSVCRQSYSVHNHYTKIPDEQFDSAVICAGDLSGGKDTCQGDSGGPLMLPERFEGTYRFHLIGVVSYGISGCGRANVPSVLTSTQYFMDWIIQQVQDMP